ncbi:hypothetical protein [Streptomyces chartreusis]|uniref:hypothetical protein n=1 Tax=Streptomyces chartreusis TaxID=1969 RepID=UPI0036CF2617
MARQDDASSLLLAATSERQGERERTGRLVPAAQQQPEPDHRLKQSSTGLDTVQSVPGKGVPDGRRGGKVTGDDSARVNAVGSVGRGAPGTAAQEPLHRGRRHGGEQADAVDPVVG